MVPAKLVLHASLRAEIPSGNWMVLEKPLVPGKKDLPGKMDLLHHQPAVTTGECHTFMVMYITFIILKQLLNKKTLTRGAAVVVG